MNHHTVKTEYTATLRKAVALFGTMVRSPLCTPTQVEFAFDNLHKEMIRAMKVLFRMPAVENPENYIHPTSSSHSELLVGAVLGMFASHQLEQCSCEVGNVLGFTTAIMSELTGVPVDQLLNTAKEVADRSKEHFRTFGTQTTDAGIPAGSFDVSQLFSALGISSAQAQQNSASGRVPPIGAFIVDGDVNVSQIDAILRNIVTEANAGEYEVKSPSDVLADLVKAITGAEQELSNYEKREIKTMAPDRRSQASVQAVCVQSA